MRVVDPENFIKFSLLGKMLCKFKNFNDVWLMKLQLGLTFVLSDQIL